MRHGFVVGQSLPNQLEPIVAKQPHGPHDIVVLALHAIDQHLRQGMVHPLAMPEIFQKFHLHEMQRHGDRRGHVADAFLGHRATSQAKASHPPCPGLGLGTALRKLARHGFVVQNPCMLAAQQRFHACGQDGANPGSIFNGQRQRLGYSGGAHGVLFVPSEQLQQALCK